MPIVCAEKWKLHFVCSKTTYLSKLPENSDRFYFYPCITLWTIVTRFDAQFPLPFWNINVYIRKSNMFSTDQNSSHMTWAPATTYVEGFNTRTVQPVHSFRSRENGCHLAHGTLNILNYFFRKWKGFFSWHMYAAWFVWLYDKQSYA